ncbi:MULTISPECIES: DNA polymerase III subunit gamma/tau [Ramlibacter]|uniref:DNA polymerase III subunit gamma/tau n=1 Tax=Ramlibacter aquaticus TaxID=2780094 RepID=A0ABR9SDR1_9BURK|nr:MULTISPECIES: DNA polymerase III subunit gamma/tau [Ramlibacter]MBE7940192.1 DNA polymerase III subunit gamma/tau [Ramlibacter aquaticus]
MSYLVLARKYRPRNFSEMVGQEHVVQALGNALTQQRLHHAYLFTGTRGVGKTTVSRILAKSLNCQGPDGQGGITATPCGICQACTEIDAGRFVDYVELDAASNRGVDEVQALLEQAVYKPVQGRFKVFMIDEVHMLTGHAFNAMLKTLEEPPEYLKFVLATTDPQKVPVTVLSRCLQFNLRPMAPETVQAHLSEVLEAEGVPCEPLALRLLSRAARGSMRDALSLTDQAIAFGGGTVLEAAVRQMLGSVDRSHVFRLIDALARGDGAAVVELVDALRTHGLSAGSTLEEMAAVLQRMAVLQAVPNARADDDPDAAVMARLAQGLPADETQLLYSLVLHGRAELGLATDEYAALVMVLLRLLAFRSPAAEKKTLIDAGGPVAAARTAAAPPPPTRPEPEPARETGPAVAAAVPPQAGVPEAQALPAQSTPPAAAAAAGVMPPAAPVPSPAARRPQPAGSPDNLPPWEDVDAVPAEPADLAADWAAATLVRPAGSQPAPAAVRAVPAASAPPGQVLPVREARGAGPAPGQPVPAANGEVLGVPVRVQPEPRREVAAPAPLQPTEEGDFWHATVMAMVQQESITALVRELALQSQLVGRDEGHWVLRVERESLNQPASRERLRTALNAAGHAVTLAVEVGVVTDSPARRNAAAAEARQRAAEQIILQDPFVQDMMRDFGAKIVPGSIKPT